MVDRLAEIGGPSTHNNYPWGWTMAGNTPFKRWKREVHHGGVADPCIVSWPRRFGGADGTPGQVRHQFAHAVDVLPTVLELAGVDPPAVIDHVPQSRIDGTSFAYLLGPDGAAAPERHETQYFEMFGSRAIYHQGWKAVTFHPVGPLYDDGLDPNAPFDDDVWELYHVAEDLSETDDLADRASPSGWPRWSICGGTRPTATRSCRSTTGCCGHSSTPSPTAADRGRATGTSPAAPRCPRRWPSTCGTGHTRSSSTSTCPTGSSRPRACCSPSARSLGGWSLHVVGGRVRYVHNLYGKTRHVLEADRALGPGRHVVRFDFDKDGPGPAATADTPGGTGTIRYDGDVVADGAIERFTPAGFNGVGVGLTCGYEWGPAVGEGYDAPFPFNGTIVRATVEVTGPVVRDPLAELAAILAEQ